MSVLVWTVVTLVLLPVAYAVLCATVFLYVRLPDEPHFAVLEDLLLVATAPFVGAVLGLTYFRRER